MTDIPKDHPRYKSLKIREKLVEGFKKGIVVPQGLIAHGRGECFDYLIGEKTLDIVKKSYEAAAALLLSSKHPILAVNGNAAALAYEDIIKFSLKYDIPVEINIFHYDKERISKIASLFHGTGVKLIKEHDSELPTVSSMRRKVSKEGILRADTVMVMIEDGDMPRGLKQLGKKVIAVDLNPLSRTSRDSDITIVDNIVRVFPTLSSYMDKLKVKSHQELEDILRRYDNHIILTEVLKFISSRLESLEF